MRNEVLVMMEIAVEKALKEKQEVVSLVLNDEQIEKFLELPCCEIEDFDCELNDDILYVRINPER